MPSSKEKSKETINSKRANVPLTSPDAAIAGVGSGELDSRKAVKQLPASRQTKFVRDYSRAIDLLQEAQESLALSPFADSSGQQSSSSPSDSSHDCRHNLHACACLVQAIPLLTDCRIPVETTIVQLLPGSPMTNHITGDAHAEGFPNLMYMGFRLFLVILADALLLMLRGHPGHARRTVHELEAQIDGDYIDFGELSSEPDLFCGLTPTDVHFALAVLGIKINRMLYRLPPNQRTEGPPGFFEVPDEATLLSDCRRFAEQQNQLRPDSPVPSMNHAWVETEARNFAAAHDWYEKSVVRADAAEDDVVKCTSRIQLAGSLILGSGRHPPIFKVKRSEIEYLYNAFRDGCRGLDEWHMGEFPRGEASMDAVVEDYLRRYPPSKADSYGYVPTLVREDAGIERDKGAAPTLHKCDGCGNDFIKVMRCGGCKKAFYCGKDCQAQHWKAGHKAECKRRQSNSSGDS